MARVQLRSPSQPFWLRLVLGLFEFCASLKLAVVLIFTCAFVLGAATFVESAYGTPAVQFGIYGTWWFGLLNALLALNIFCAAAIRYPWKRHQTGFVITHIGLLVLLFGCLLSRRGGVDAQMPVFEGHMGNTAYEDSYHLELAVAPAGNFGAGTETVYPIGFTTGPFNWQDYGEKFSWFPWGLATRNRPGDVLFDRDGVKLEVLDFYSDSTEVDVPLLKLQLSSPRMAQIGADGEERLGPEAWVPLSLGVRSQTGVPLPGHPFGIGERKSMGGGSLVFWLAGSEAETRSFLEGLPEGPLGAKGQVVLLVDGAVHRISVEERLGKGRFALGEGIEAEVVAWYAKPGLSDRAGPDNFALEEAGSPSNPEEPTVELKVYRQGQPESRLVLFADLPELSVQDHEAQVFGNYWFDHGEKSGADLLEGKGSSRIDIVQGHDQKLYYRYWNRKQVVWARELPQGGEHVDAFKMPIAQLKMYVEEFIPSQQPEKRTLPVAYSKEKVFDQKRAAARLRLTVDGHAEEFWLASKAPEPFGSLFADKGTEKRTVRGGRRLVLTMPPDQVELGFRVKLEDFERKLDPGTSQPSHYSSMVRFVDLHDDERIFRGEDEPVLITMNAPVDVRDPSTGRSYRLFQESFNGPYFPDGEDRIFQRFAGSSPRDHLFYSVLTVNFDPGRGIKYIGSLLIVAGIATMFYMRAYFFTGKRREPAAAKPQQQASVVRPRRSVQPVS